MMISVVLPAYNCEKFIKKRVESIFNQQSIEIYPIIIDDNSSDTTGFIIADLIKERSIFFEVNEVNSGSPFIQWNKGVAKAKSELIWIAESDDFCSDNFIEQVLSFFKQNPNIGLVYTQSIKVDAEGISHGTWLDWTMELEGGQIFERDFIMDGKEFIKKFLIKKNVIPNASAVVFRRELYEAVGGADESIRYCSDWLTWLKILTKCDVGFVAEPLNYFRFHDNSVIATAKGHMLENDIPMRLKFHAFLQQEKLEGLLNESAHMLEQDYLNLGIYYYHNGEKLKGIATILRSISYAENKFATAWTRLKYITGLLLKWVPNR
jgi:glycosyltransferase involved in cell wall biosynthesis